MEAWDAIRARRNVREFERFFAGRVPFLLDNPHPVRPPAA